MKKFYTVAGRAIGFALEQPLHVVTLACSASGILNSFSIGRETCKLSAMITKWEIF
jgi:hypothetical protein